MGILSNLAGTKKENIMPKNKRKRAHKVSSGITTTIRARQHKRQEQKLSTFKLVRGFGTLTKTAFRKQVRNARTDDQGNIDYSMSQRVAFGPLY